MAGTSQVSAELVQKYNVYHELHQEGYGSSRLIPIGNLLKEYSQTPSSDDKISLEKVYVVKHTPDCNYSTPVRVATYYSLEKARKAIDVFIKGDNWTYEEGYWIKYQGPFQKILEIEAEELNPKLSDIRT